MKNKYYALIILIVVLVVLSVDFLILGQNSEGYAIGGMATNVSSQTGHVYLLVVGACNPDLVQGWNLFSICANVSNSSVDSVLSSLGSDYRYVMEWDEVNQDFEIYSPRAASNPFDEFNWSRSYFVYYYPASGILALQGSDYDDLDIFAAYGWDVPFYPYTFTANVSDYLDSIHNDYRFMMKWDAPLQEFDIYSPRAVNNPFTTIDEGDGQYIYVRQSSGVLIEYNKTKLQG